MLATQIPVKTVVVNLSKMVHSNVIVLKDISVKLAMVSLVFPNSFNIVLYENTVEVLLLKDFGEMSFNAAKKTMVLRSLLLKKISMSQK